ncbi:helix-turn-helix domain-containing protein [Paractinoplanes ferrugineus]|nr:helix-turn-helix domain-containing protein [Actinoplanes ferrugineus]
MVEVIKHAPADLNPTERLTLVVIAESCRTETRMTYYRDGWDAEELARRVGVTPESLTKVFRSLAKKGLEVRVPHAVKDGKPVFAFKGKQTTFKLPRLTPQRVDESPGFTEVASHKAWTSVRQSLDEGPGNEAQSLDESPPLLLKVLPSKNTSSLSPREDDPPTAAIVPAPRTEREIEVASQKPEAQEHTPIHRLLLDAGCPSEDLTDVEAEMIVRHQPRSPAWWRTVTKAGDLPGLVAEVLEALHPEPIFSPEHLADAHAFESKNDGSPDCKHCTFPAANGRHKAVGYTARKGAVPNNNGRRSTSSQRAADILAIGRQLQQESEYGQYAPGQVRSPADQRLADAAPLYDHYRALEGK